jgi:hypothetical protein
MIYLIDIIARNSVSGGQEENLKTQGFYQTKNNVFFHYKRHALESR